MFDKCFSYRVPNTTSEQLWQYLSQAGCFVTRADGLPFTYAAGEEATVKTDFEQVYRNRRIFRKVGKLCLEHPCLREADTLSYVPNGARGLARYLGRQLRKPVIDLIRPADSPRFDIQPVGNTAKLASKAAAVCVIEDVASSGLSSFVAADVLREINPQLELHVLSLLERGKINPIYQNGPQGVAYHTLLKRKLPADLHEFMNEFPNTPVRLV